jgi:conjugative transfer signal peptidase TraF
MTDRRDQRCRVGKCRIGLVAAGASCAALAGTFLWKPAPVLLWNASPSSPVGIYWVRHSRALGIGGTAIAWPPPAARRLAARRHYLPAGVPLVKNVAAVSGARICAAGAAVFVNGRQVAVRRSRDRAGHRLPWWSGCRTLGEGELFLLSPHVPEAFDGRYFGITRAREVIGEGKLLWAR